MLYKEDYLDNYYSDGVIEYGMEDVVDGRVFTYVEPCTDIVDLDDRWQVWKVEDTEESRYYGETFYVVVDIDSGFIDWDCDSYEEATDFLYGKQSDYEDNDEYEDIDLDYYW